MQLGGIHHLTAISARIRDNYRFYTGPLGMRLVKRSVNQDDVSAYHLFYADEVGSPGTDLTFFDWPLAGPDQRGVGTIAAIAFGVHGREALEWWVERFDAFKVRHESIQERGEDRRAVLVFQDPEEQRLE